MLFGLNKFELFILLCLQIFFKQRTYFWLQIQNKPSGALTQTQ